MGPAEIDRVRAGYDAFNRRDIDGILPLLAPDIVYRMPLDPLGVHPVFHGHDGVRAFHETVWGGFEEFTIELESVKELPGDVFVAVGHVTARPPGGARTRFGISHFWKMGGDRAVAVAFHDAMNPLTLLEADPPASAASEEG